ncbi:MAG: hypothetical protein ACRDLM_07320 [Gaiellaceae bacterium]
MTAVRAVWRGISIPQLLILSGLCAYAVTFALLVNYGRPGLGVSGGFYVAVILVAAATSPATGVLAAFAAAFLVVLAAHHGQGLAWTDFDKARVLTHLAGYAAAGVLTGFLARRVRRMLAQSLYVLEDLIELARDREVDLS